LKLHRANLLELQKKVLGAQLKLKGPGKEKNISQVFDFLYLVEELNSQVNYLRKNSQPEDPLLLDSEDALAGAAYDILIRSSQGKRDREKLRITEKYRLVWRKHFKLFLFTLALFIISSLIGYSMTLAQPDYGTLFVGQAMLENIMDHKAWFERIQKSPLTYGFGIAWNNIQVAFTAFTLGALAGVGGIFVLAFNGLMLGSILALCHIYKFDQSLVTFIVGHGPLELTLIVASTFGSLIFGRCFYTRPISQIRAKAKIAVQESVYILYGVTIWLSIAAMVEVFISPWQFFSSSQKMIFGLILVGAFWIWTFGPTPSKVKRSL